MIDQASQLISKAATVSQNKAFDSSESSQGGQDDIKKYQSLDSNKITFRSSVDQTVKLNKNEKRKQLKESQSEVLSQADTKIKLKPGSNEKKLNMLFSMDQRDLDKVNSLEVNQYKDTGKKDDLIISKEVTVQSKTQRQSVVKYDDDEMDQDDIGLQAKTDPDNDQDEVQNNITTNLNDYTANDVLITDHSDSRQIVD